MSFDRGVRVLDGGRTLIGGDPTRVIRLTPQGATAIRDLVSGRTQLDRGSGAAIEALLHRLLDAGIVHRRPRAASPLDVTVVIPVRDRPDALARCLEGVSDSLEGREEEHVGVIVVDDGSLDAGAVQTVCNKHGARLICRQIPGGPAAARNASLSAVDTALVAFLDSDCVPEPGWLDVLNAAMADPSTAAVAPRIRPAAGADTTLDRYAAARSALDMGERPAWVRPGTRVSYVPSAALLIRRTALEDGFDRDLRFGEDVDLIWRLHDAGWRIRYEPEAVVRHSEPRQLLGLLKRRFQYGTSAGPLALRHPRRLAPIVIHPRPMAVAALLLSGRLRLPLAALSAHTLLAARRLNEQGVPPAVGISLTVESVHHSLRSLGTASTMFLPWAVAGALTRRRLVPAALALTLIEPLSGWVRLSPQLDPVRWTALVLADDLAYGAGVWSGAITSRTWAPLRPRSTGMSVTEGRAGDRDAAAGCVRGVSPRATAR